MKAPIFKSISTNKNNFDLKNFSGKYIVLYFYPKDMTPGCTAQSCNLTENYSDLQAKGYEVLGVSCDSVKRHQKFIKKYNLAFSLVSDEEKKVVEDYGVWGLKKFMGREYMGISRTTFIIDEKGILRR